MAIQDACAIQRPSVLPFRDMLNNNFHTPYVKWCEHFDSMDKLLLKGVGISSEATNPAEFLAPHMCFIFPN